MRGWNHIEANQHSGRRRVSRTLLFRIALLGLIGSGTAVAAPHYGGTLRVLTETSGWGYDAIKTRMLMGDVGITARLIMERLFDLDGEGNLIPLLGLSATPSKDHLSWTIRLRAGVEFHDGTPFNADAVVSHWQRMLNPENKYRGRLILRPVTSVERTGSHEVVFHLEHPWKPFLSILAHPGGFTSLIPSPKAVADDTQNRSPVGTGPFVFKEWVSGDHITVTKNPNYWQKGKPYLDEFTIRAIPDHEGRNAAFLSGQADVLVTDRPKHVLQLARDPNYIELKAGGEGLTILAMNTAKPPLDDVRVRQALAHAWDQEKYLKVSFRDIMPYAEHWFGDTLACGDYGYRKPDLEKAKALLADYGKPVELEYIHSASQRGREAGEIIQQLFGRAGVRVTPVPMDFGGIAKSVFSKKYDLASWVIPGSPEMGPISLAILHSKSPWNVTRYSNEEVDELLVKQNTSLDQATREEALCSVARKVNDEVPFLNLFGRGAYMFTTKSVRGIPAPRNWNLDFANAWIQP